MNTSLDAWGCSRKIHSNSQDMHKKHLLLKKYSDIETKANAHWLWVSFRLRKISASTIMHMNENVLAEGGVHLMKRKIELAVKYFQIFEEYMVR